MAVCDRNERFIVESDGPHFSAQGIINATGTWETPYIPDYPGADRFKGEQLHTKEYHKAQEFAGKHVLIVGGGISAIDLMYEISQVAETTWVTRRPPKFRQDRKSTRLNSSHVAISYAVFCLIKKKQ